MKRGMKQASERERDACRNLTSHLGIIKVDSNAFGGETVEDKIK